MLYAARWMTAMEPKHIIYENGLPKLFKTKRAAREWISTNYGYIATRKDLRAAPHYWRMPKVIEVLVFECTNLRSMTNGKQT